MQNNSLPATNDLNVADKGTRFGNYILDSLSFFFVIFLHAMVLDSWLGIMPEGGSNWFGVYFFFLYVMFHAIFEYYFGKTPGKFLTKTKVVKKDGSKPTFINILGRNAARFIPFDAFSYLISERGWHDQISDTYVVYVVKDIK